MLQPNIYLFHSINKGSLVISQNFGPDSVNFLLSLSGVYWRIPCYDLDVHQVGIFVYTYLSYFGTFHIFLSRFDNSSWCAHLTVFQVVKSLTF